ncbi:MAG: M15 family metallopeptidase [Patescibacteria group bacterium]
MKQIPKPAIVLILLVIILSAFSYLIWQYYLVYQELARTNKKLIFVSQTFSNLADWFGKDVFQLKIANQNLTNLLKSEQGKNQFFAKQISGIQSTVSDLEKLNQLDEELLKKYSKVYFLNEHYLPQQLSIIDKKYAYNQNEVYQIHSQAKPYLYQMLEAADSDGMPIKIISAYRSFADQANLKSSYKMVYGSGANQFSADQGYSEHQLGTAIDLTTPELGAEFYDFAKTPAYQWLLNNAYKYGFILSYPENNAYYVFEPWHWRFVGVMLATELHTQNRHFYDLDQREIDRYLINIFD